MVNEYYFKPLNDVPIKMIAKLLGDDERMVLEVYSHIVDEKENVAETINKVFTNGDI